MYYSYESHIWSYFTSLIAKCSTMHVLWNLGTISSITLKIGSSATEQIEGNSSLFVPKKGETNNRQSWATIITRSAGPLTICGCCLLKHTSSSAMPVTTKEAKNGNHLYNVSTISRSCPAMPQPPKVLQLNLTFRLRMKKMKIDCFIQQKHVCVFYPVWQCEFILEKSLQSCINLNENKSWK